MSKRKFSSMVGHLEYKNSKFMLYDAITHFQIQIKCTKLCLRSYIELKELLTLYRRLFNKPDDIELKHKVLKKIHDINWENIIKYQITRIKEMSGPEYSHLNINEKQIIKDLQGLQTGELFLFNELPPSLIRYLATISKFKIQEQGEEDQVSAQVSAKGTAQGRGKTKRRKRKKEPKKKKLETKKKVDFKKLRKHISQKVKSIIKRTKTRSKPKKK